MGYIIYQPVCEEIFGLLNTEARRYFLPLKPVEEIQPVIVTHGAELDHDGAQVVLLEDSRGRRFLGVPGIDGEGKFNRFTELSGAVLDLNRKGEFQEIQIPEGANGQKKKPR